MMMTSSEMDAGDVTSPAYNLLDCSGEVQGNTSDISGRHSDYSSFVEHVIYSKVVTTVCAFGLVGNIFNVVVLIKRTSRCLRESMERAAYTGLVALAVSDMAFCVSVLPHAFVDRREARELHHSLDFSMLYEAFHNAIINTFAASSTWLTVYMALSRCVAICFPLRMRSMFNLSLNKAAIVLVFIMAAILNLPRFWSNSVSRLLCTDGSTAVYIGPGPLRLYSKKVYTYVHFSLCILLPLVLMAVSNAFLIRELRDSAARRRACTQASRRTHRGPRPAPGNIVTLTMVLIVIFYFILVVPVELMSFFSELVRESCQTHMYNIGLAAANCLQAVNFSFNFALYCALSPQFRHTVADIFHCACCPRFRYRHHQRGCDVPVRPPGALCDDPIEMYPLSGTPNGRAACSDSPGKSLIQDKRVLLSRQMTIP